MPGGVAELVGSAARPNGWRTERKARTEQREPSGERSEGTDGGGKKVDQVRWGEGRGGLFSRQPGWR